MHELAREASQPLVGGELLGARARLIRKAELEPLLDAREERRVARRVGEAGEGGDDAQQQPRQLMREALDLGYTGLQPGSHRVAAWVT